MYPQGLRQPLTLRCPRSELFNTQLLSALWNGGDVETEVALQLCVRPFSTHSHIGKILSSPVLTRKNYPAAFSQIAFSEYLANTVQPFVMEYSLDATTLANAVLPSGVSLRREYLLEGGRVVALDAWCVARTLARSVTQRARVWQRLPPQGAQSQSLPRKPRLAASLTARAPAQPVCPQCRARSATVHGGPVGRERELGRGHNGGAHW